LGGAKMFEFMYATCEHTVTYSFVDSALCNVWFSEVLDLQSVIEEINDDGHAGPPRVPKYQGWLELVNAFVQKWGEKFLPPDVKISVNDVEGNIGVPVTVWEDSPDNYRV